MNDSGTGTEIQVGDVGAHGVCGNAEDGSRSESLLGGWSAANTAHTEVLETTSQCLDEATSERLGRAKVGVPTIHRAQILLEGLAVDGVVVEQVANVADGRSVGGGESVDADGGAPTLEELEFVVVVVPSGIGE